MRSSNNSDRMLGLRPSEAMPWRGIRRWLTRGSAAGPVLAVGQVWQTQENWLMIGRIDSFEQGNVISVAAYRDAQTREPIAAHLPFSEPTFRKSAQRLVARNRQLPEGFEEGYRTWRAAFDSGQAGLW